MNLLIIEPISFFSLELKPYINNKRKYTQQKNKTLIASVTHDAFVKMKFNGNETTPEISMQSQVFENIVLKSLGTSIPIFL